MPHSQSPVSGRRQALRRFIILAVLISTIPLISVGVADAQEPPSVITSVDDRIPPPHSVTATFVDTNLLVDWRLGTLPQTQIDGLGSLKFESFTVERRILSGHGPGSWQRLISHLNGNGYATRMPLQSGRTYEFRVAAFYIEDSSEITYRYKTPYSEPGSFTAPIVPAPSDLKVIRGDHGIALSWTRPDPFDHDVLEHTGYLILRTSVDIADGDCDASSVIPQEEIELSNAEATTWLDNTTVSTKRYRYRIQAVYDYVYSWSAGGAPTDFILGARSSR